MATADVLLGQSESRSTRDYVDHYQIHRMDQSMPIGSACRFRIDESTDLKGDAQARGTRTCRGARRSRNA
jgi:hypothetical protein